MQRSTSFLALAITASGLLSGCTGGGIPEGSPPKEVGYVAPGANESATPPVQKGAAAPKK
jgi:hypothetical protein